MVTEALRLLDFDTDEQEEDDESDNEDIAVDGVETGGHSKRKSLKPPTQREKPPRPPLFQFQELVSMLAVLHPRIKTEHPSRFLATSLQAVLVAYQRAGADAELLTDSILAFVKAISGSKRPQLPPRTSSGNILATTTVTSAADPEASSKPAAPEEAAIQERLLQSFITHVLEDYMLSLTSAEDVTGLAWCSRYMEKLAPERIPDVPGKIKFADRFATEEPLIARSSTIGQIVAIAQDLKLLGAPELLVLCLSKDAETAGHPNREDDPPDSVEDIPLSKTGALFLIAAALVKQVLFDASGKQDPISIFSEHATILENYIGTSFQVGLENEALVDAVLFLGLLSLAKNMIGEPEDDEHFVKYIQTTSLLSANCPSPTLRYHAHYLASTLLRSHPSDLMRLSYIRDTLEHCPYENLKATAVGWVKGETIEANLVPLMQAQGGTASNPAEPEEEGEENIFATPVALSTVAPFLFSDPAPEIGPAVPLEDAWMHFKTNLTFYLTTLNFYYFLLKAQPLHKVLEVKNLDKEMNISAAFLPSLKSAIDKFKAELSNGQLKDEEGDDAEATRAELGIFAELMENITSESAKLN